MKIQETPLRCKKCDTRFVGEVVLPAPIEVYLASLKAQRCPKCGADFMSLAFGITQEGELVARPRENVNWAELREEVIERRSVTLDYLAPTDGKEDPMSWNYRVIEFKADEGTLYQQIHEVYYDDAGKPASYTTNPIHPVAYQEDGGDDMAAALRWQLEHMLKALDKPVLTEKDFFKRDDAT
jgi:hypothetical protein